ncbi:triose-phosphate isomerase [Candidatus Woesearchaeota archaeon]|nr:triose-phosphate isomerase [Candidatus Woesearchaeota archaeon]
MNSQIMIINFKTYRQATGSSAVRLARDCEAVSKKSGVSIAVAVQACDISGVASSVSIEHKLDFKVLADSVRLCRRLNLTTVVCAADNSEASSVAGFSPDFIAVEPPELIGTGVSVSKARPDVVASAIAAVNRVKDIPVLCGAGITTGDDVIKALNLGAAGVLLSSSVATAANPKAVLSRLVKGFI